ncbi:MAG: protease complex subunit PrcB family protein [Candidatus Binatia bacterium]
MKRTGALVTLSLPFIPSITNTNFQAAAQPATPFSHLLRVAAVEPNKSTDRVSFKTIAKGVHSGVREPSQIAVRSQREWQKLWRQHTSTSTVPAPLPVVDFDKEIVVAVFLGEKSSGGYGVEISSAEVVGRSLTVFVKETSPKPGAIVTQAINQPFHIVRIETAGVETVSFRRAP